MKLDPVGGLEPHRLETLSYVEGVIRAMREAAGDRCDILIGTHGQLTTHAAIRLAKQLEPTSRCGSKSRSRPATSTRWRASPTPPQSRSPPANG